MNKIILLAIIMMTASTLVVGAINHREGFPAMPKGGEQLDTCQINIIEAWVNQGSLNN